MRILEGEIPEGKRWRVLVLLTPDHEPGLVWGFAQQLAEASDGEAIATFIMPETASESTLQQARATLTAARRTANDDDRDTAHFLLVEAHDFRRAMLRLVTEGDIDLLIADSAHPNWPELERLPCALAAMRGSAYAERYAESDRPADEPVKRILVPTSGGPNTALALTFLLPLTPEVDITALYVTPSYLGESEEGLGKARLRQLTNFVDASQRLEHKVVQADSVTDGIVHEASGPYDLVIIGASRESSLDRVLFGDVVGSVVRRSKTPVIVVWEARKRLGNLARDLAWRFQDIIPRLTLSERTQVYVRVRRSARPNTDFYVLIGLSALIAALGLLLDSPAVVIGAMLVAPLMSPIVGAGMAIVQGNPRFLRLSVGAVLKGAITAVGLSIFIGLLWLNQPLTSEILSRTEPTLLDLGVAVFAGLAGAYALAHSEAAAALPGVAISAALVPPLSAAGIAMAKGNWAESFGALLLFSTNFIAIVAAAVLVFIILGFRPMRAQKAQRTVQMRSVRAAMILLGTITVLLGVTTYRLVREATLDSRIRSVTEDTIGAVEGVDFVEMAAPEALTDVGEPLALDVTVRASRILDQSELQSLRDNIAEQLEPILGPNRPVVLTLTVIPVTRLVPEAVPPAATEPAPEARTPLAPILIAAQPTIS